MEGRREDAFGVADSTITPHSATICTWLLCACLQIKERMDDLFVGPCRLLCSVGLCAIVRFCCVRLSRHCESVCVCVWRGKKYSDFFFSSYVFTLLCEGMRTTVLKIPFLEYCCFKVDSAAW